MKSIFQIAILILVFSCGENRTTKDKVENLNSAKDKLEKQNENVFKPDSSYVEYWCSTKILKKTEETIDKLELITIAEFLATFHKDCSNNIEYSEWSNELLFKVAKKNPYFLLQLLYKNDSLDKELIKRNFENPINDEIDLDKIIHNIREVISPINVEKKIMVVKKEILESLEIAKSKY